MNKNSQEAIPTARACRVAARQKRRWGLRLCLLLWALVAQLVLPQAVASGVEAIVSPDQGGVQIDRAMLRAIFTTRLRQWPDGTPIHVFVLPDDSAVHDQFCREQLGMYPYVLRELWDRLLYTGTGLTPTVVRTESEMRTRVHTTAGAIGYTSTTSAGTSSRGTDNNTSVSLNKSTALAFLRDPP